MPLVIAVSFLLGLLVALALSLILWGYWEYRRSQRGPAQVDMTDSVLVGFLLLAVFASGVCLAYVLMTI